MSYELGELEQIVRPDGATYNLGDGGSRGIISIGGRGAPAVQYLTARGYMQHSETVTGWLLQPRTITALIQFADLPDRAAYWAARQELMDFMRPNAGGDYTLLHTRADGTRRAIQVRPDSTPTHEDDHAQWPSMAASLSWIAHDPTFYDPTAHSISLLAQAIDELHFPLLFDVPSINYIANGNFSSGVSGWSATNGWLVDDGGEANFTPTDLPATMYQTTNQTFRPGETVAVSVELTPGGATPWYVQITISSATTASTHVENYVVVPGSAVTESFSFDVGEYWPDVVFTITVTDAPESESLWVDDVSMTITALPTPGGISFDDGSLVGSETTITYQGNWATYPTVTIQGPYTSLTLRNATTDRAIVLGQPIVAGQSRTLVLTPGAQSITDENGDDVFSELVLPDTDLSGFNIRPSGVPANDSPYEGVTGGTNVIRAEGDGFQDGMTQVTLAYYDRYLSIA